MFRRMAAGGLCVLTACGTAGAAEVWKSTFDSGPDGVVDVVDRSASKALVGPASGGRLQITTQDKPGAFNDNDRGGRALGATLNGNNSFSGLYEFRFTALNQDISPQMWEMTGFIGNDNNSTQQQIGVIQRHHKVGGNYYTTLDMVFHESGRGRQVFDATGAGADPTAPYSPTAVFLGPDGQGRDLKLAIGYDGESHVLRAALYDGAGNLMSGNSVDLDAKIVPNGTFTQQDVLNNLQATHLGWADYVATGDNRITEWSVDSLSYFNDANGAFTAAVPEPATAGVLALVAGALAIRRRR